MNLQQRVDDATSCLSVMRDELSQYNNVIVGSGNTVNGSQNIIVGNYNSINGINNFVFINNFTGSINGSLLLSKWKIDLAKKELIRINPSWAIFFINDDENKLYEKYLKRGSDWMNAPGISQTTVSVFQDIREAVTTSLQKGMTNLPTPVVNNNNGQVNVSSLVSASTTSSSNILPNVSNLGGASNSVSTLTIPATTTNAPSSVSINQQQQSVPLISNIQSTSQTSQLVGSNIVTFPANLINGFVPPTIQPPTIPTIPNPVLTYSFSNVNNMPLGMTVNSGNIINPVINSSPTAVGGNNPTKPVSTVTIVGNLNPDSSVNLSVKNINLGNPTVNSQPIQSTQSRNLRVEETPTINPFNPFNNGVKINIIRNPIQTFTQPLFLFPFFY